PLKVPDTIPRSRPLPPKEFSTVKRLSNFEPAAPPCPLSATTADEASFLTIAPIAFVRFLHPERALAVSAPAVLIRSGSVRASGSDRSESRRRPSTSRLPGEAGTRRTEQYSGVLHGP